MARSRIAQGHGYRGAVRGVALTETMGRECPRCKATRGDRCFRLSSWVADEAHPNGGFYTARMEGVHDERKTARTPAVAVVPQERTVLRQTINALIMRKLSGNERIKVRIWAGSVKRTPEELAAKIGELKQLGDLSW